MEGTETSDFGRSATVAEVRERIDRAGDELMRQSLRAAFLWCARESEVVGRAYKPETAYGPKGNDAEPEVWRDPEGRLSDEKALVFHVKTAKRGGLLRNVGLPLNDPWVMTLAEFMWEKGEGEAFPLNRQELVAYVNDNDVFEGLSWDLMEYSIFESPAVRDAKGRIVTQAVVKQVPAHRVKFTVHRLRDARATYLINEKHFDGVELAIHGGWAINRTLTGITPVMAKYLKPIYEIWERPFPKLL